ncbi:MAG: histidine phosphatase family protein [Nanoarchaeota archaeon]|nr:histidine phosphatase family protein [Nanoarchaeota archaeon]
MIIYLVRHGQSVANAQKRSAGYLDTPLTQEGVEQAQRLGLRFKDINDFEVIYTSDLQRAYNTAKEIHKFHKEKKFEVDTNIREKNFGELENISFDTAQLKYEGSPIHWDVKGGESFETHLKRVEEFVIKILEKKENCVIVNHGLTIKMLLYLLKGYKTEEELFKIKSGNTAVYKLELKEKEVKIHLHNCIEHLREGQ